MYRASKLSAQELRRPSEDLEVQMTAVMKDIEDTRVKDTVGKSATNAGYSEGERRMMSDRLVKSASTWKDKLKKMLMSKYKNDLTSDMEVIYTTSENRQIGSNLLSLINQVLDHKQHPDKSHDRDLFIFYSIKHKKIPLHMFEKVMPDVKKIYSRMRQAAENMGI